MGLLQDGNKSPLCRRVLEVVLLSFATVVLGVVMLVSMLANLPNANQFGFLNATERLFTSNRTLVNPAGWTFSVWGFIWIWQTLMVLYAWSFVFRPHTPRTISWVSLLLYTATNTSGIIWYYTFSNDYRTISFPFVFGMWAFIVAAIAVQSVHLYKLTPRLLRERNYKIDLWITRILVLNALYTYATWLTLATTHLDPAIRCWYTRGYYNSCLIICACCSCGWLFCSGEHSP